MSSDDYLNENFGKALDFVGPRVDRWIKELFKGFEVLNISTPQKELIQGLTVESMLYNTLMQNDEIVAMLGGIIQNIANKHSYANSLDWGKRVQAFDKYANMQE